MTRQKVSILVVGFIGFILGHLLIGSDPRVDATAMGQDSQKPNNVEVLSLKKLVIQDKNGRDRIAMGVDEDQPYMLMLDDKQTPRIQFSIHEDGTTGIYIYDSNRRGRVRLAYLSNGDAELALVDSKERPAIMAARPKGVSGFSLYDEKEKAVLALIMEADESRSLMATDKSGRIRVDLGVSKTGTAALTLINREGQKRSLREPK